MSQNEIDLSQLPPLEILQDIGLEARFEEIRQDYIDLLSDEEREEFLPVSRLRSEPLVKFFELQAIREGQVIATVNDAARALVLSHSYDSNLDHIAATYLRTQRFTLQEADEELGIEEIKENDNSLRNRARLAPDQFATAGPSDAWVALALSADEKVKDANHASPAPNENIVTVLSRDANGIASQALLDNVLLALDDDEDVPDGEIINVQSTQIIPWQVEATLLMQPGPDSALVFERALNELQTYADEQHFLGRSIRVGNIYRALQQPGVEKVTLISPLTDIETTDTQAPFLDNIDVTEVPLA